MVPVKVGKWEMLVPRSVANDPAKLDVIIKMLQKINEV